MSTKKYLNSYIYGLVISLALTMAAYSVVMYHILSSASALLVLGILALLQFAAQIIFFLHIGTTAATRDKTLSLGLAVVVVFILVGGSLWIMNDLNGRMMPSDDQMTHYMNSQQGI